MHGDGHLQVIQGILFQVEAVELHVALPNADPQHILEPGWRGWRDWRERRNAEPVAGFGSAMRSAYPLVRSLVRVVCPNPLRRRLD